jgi:hypothetical protein
MKDRLSSIHVRNADIHEKKIVSSFLRVNIRIWHRDKTKARTISTT